LAYRTLGSLERIDGYEFARDLLYVAFPEVARLDESFVKK